MHTENGITVTSEEYTSYVDKYSFNLADNTPQGALSRIVRDKLLKETDWWATSDRTMTQAETDYRQALRDVPAQPGFPENITWPTEPE